MSLGGSVIVPAIRLPDDYGRLSTFVFYARELGVPGFIVYGGDAELTPPFLRRLREAAERPLLMMADYERGAGTHVVGMPELPPAMALGATFSAEMAYKAGKLTAISARHIGINVVLAPVLDVLTCLENPIIGTRAFSSNPALVSELGCAFIEGVQEEGVLACAKHFPGHGDTLKDSHTALPKVPDFSGAMELAPFAAAIRAGVGMVMTAHVVYRERDPGVPATFSEKIMGETLRGRLGFGGLLITDALVMEGAKKGEEDPSVRALATESVGLLLYPEDPEVSAAVIEDAVEAGRLDAGNLSMWAGRARLAAADLAFDAPPRRDLSKEHAFEIETMARRSLTMAREADRLSGRKFERAIALVVDDDGQCHRARAFEARAADFPLGVVHVTKEGTGHTGDLAEKLSHADLIVMGLFGDVRVAKERAGFHPVLTGFCTEVLRRHKERTQVIAFGHPLLAAGLPARNVLFAWSDGPASLTAALDAFQGGGEMPGRLPVDLGEGYPYGAGRGSIEPR
jgi:beta-glucosidase-like glycosyl hydrolase